MITFADLNPCKSEMEEAKNQKTQENPKTQTEISRFLKKKIQNSEKKLRGAK